MPLDMTLFKGRPRLWEGAWHGLTMLAGAVIALPILRLLEWRAPGLYAHDLVRGGVLLAIVVPLVTYSARLKNRWKENLSQ